MIPLLLFAFVAGAGTAFSPCALPVLPAFLSASGTGGRRRPLGIALGLALTFTIVVAGLASLLSAIGLGAGFLRVIAIVMLGGFGLVLLIPPLGRIVERPLAGLSQFGPRSTGDGFWSGMTIGGALGFVYAPCAGPILAAVIGVSATQGTSLAIIGIALSYAVGSSLVLLLLGILGRKGIQAMGGSAFGARVQQVLGVVLIATAVAMSQGLDTRFQTFLAKNLPDFNIASGLEKSGTVQDQLGAIRGKSKFAPSDAPVVMGSALPVLGKAPEFTGLTDWINSDPTTLADLRGKVTLVDFWTYSCINCIRTLPQLTAWDEDYRDAGLQVVGIHTPEFDFEKSPANVRAAVAQNGIEYPVALDNDYGTWDAFGNSAWPAKYLIDAEGNVRYAHFGEGDYAETEAAIRSLLAEAGAKDLPGATHVQVETASSSELTPETYFGLSRRAGFVPDDKRTTMVQRKPAPAADLMPGQFTLGGEWAVGLQSATAGREAAVSGRVSAQKVFMVLAPPKGGSGTATVSIDGRPITAEDSGTDLTDGRARIDNQKLYRLVDLDEAKQFGLEVELSPGTTAYTFTFG
ncbi:MAG: hypothetical protein QOG62_2167 [Thermoleophilaceae bacterium]|nr:hypothetical protein [Thermoleophilaceae bacterium]